MGRLLAHMAAPSSAAATTHAPRFRVPATVLPEAPYELVKTMRASVVVLGPLVARWARPGLAAAAAPSAPAPSTCQPERGSRRSRRRSSSPRLRHRHRARGQAARARSSPSNGQTVTGTENIMMAAALADGRSGAAQLRLASRR